MTFFKDDPRLARAPLRPRRALALSPDAPDLLVALAATHGRIGGCIDRLSRLAGIDPAAALAVWQVESGGLGFVRGRPVLRFEAHRFFAEWGRDREALFDAHFQFGSRAGIDGRPWEQHRFRPDATGDWRRFHGQQDTEFAAFALACRLAGREAACRSASFGGPQIMGFNHAVIGYGSAADLSRAFARSERWQVCGFFDFCQAKDLIGPIRQHDWPAFARVYNGPGNADAYAQRLSAAEAAAGALRA